MRSVDPGVIKDGLIGIAGTLSLRSFSILFVLALVVACVDDTPAPIGEQPGDAPEIATPIPSPTLAAGLPTAPPAPPTAVPGTTPDTPTPMPSLTPSPSPTATPFPQMRIEIGQAHIAHGDLSAAATELQTGLDDRTALTLAQQEEAIFALGSAYYRDEKYASAVSTFNELLALVSGDAPSETYFFLGKSYAVLGDLPAAVGAYQAYLQRNPDMSPYVSAFIGDAYLELGDRENAILTYESAISDLAYAPMLFEIRQRLAELYVATGEFDAAVAQYKTLTVQAPSETAQGRMNYLAASAEIMSGNTDEGYRLYLQGVSDFPRAYESYLGLVVLIDEGIPVDDYQRGLVDFYAGIYDPAVSAFRQHIEATPEEYRGDTHLYLAWSYEALGNLSESLNQLEAYARFDAASSLLETARLLRRNNDVDSSIAAYLQFVEAYPEHPTAPDAAWLVASLTERSGDLAAAKDLYLQYASRFPLDQGAPEALFRAGLLSHQLGDSPAAISLWRGVAERYPSKEYASASLFWLLKTIPEDVSAEDEQTGAETAYPPQISPETGEDEDDSSTDLIQAVTSQILETASDSYYALRAKDIISGVSPFAPSGNINLFPDVESGQAEAEEWLKAWLDLDSEQNVRRLSAAIANDPRLIIGEKLWSLGLWEQAKEQLEAVRKEHTDDALHSYQLALFFRDLGLYRSSILAASSLLEESESSVQAAPEFIGRLIYPVYYQDLIVPLAEQYGFSPLLQFSLVRQESLFESFARSTAAAQGLAQVIPATGEYIALQLNWPEYKNEDLFKPYVGLTFGAYYLDQQLRTFDDQVHVALSAYNAGPGNAIRWYGRAGNDYDTYLETVDFRETRMYIERIYVGYVMYTQLWRSND